MKEKVQNRLEEYQKVMLVLNKHLAVWQHVNKMASTYDRFVRNFKKISDHHTILKQDIQELEDRNQFKNNELIERISPVIGILNIYAKDTGNQTLKKQLSAKPKKLKGLSDRKLIKLSEAIVSLRDVENNSAITVPLDEYGLNMDIIDIIKTKSEDLGIISESLKKETKARKKSAELVKKLIKKSDNILKSRLDNFALLFEHRHIDFYKEYIQARKGYVSS